LPILARFFDLTLRAARTTTAAAFAMLIAIHAQEEQSVNLSSLYPEKKAL
jgi:hypothetical protein